MQDAHEQNADRQALFSRAVAALRSALPDALAIYVYGSFATGQARADSDLDLAVLLPYRPTPWDKLSVANDVALRVGREVDVVDLRTAGDVLRREVLAHGILLHAADPEEVLLWEAGALTRYGHYREEVRPLLEDFGQTGVGYRQ